MVPALFTEEEKEPLISAVGNEVRERNMMETKENCWNFFVNKCRDNLHIVLAMSPAGDKLRVRCRNFPGLVNNTSIDWFTPWPPQALQEVAEKFLTQENFPTELNSQIVEHMVSVHLSVGRVQQTVPGSIQASHLCHSQELSRLYIHLSSPSAGQSQQDRRTEASSRGRFEQTALG